MRRVFFAKSGESRLICVSTVEPGKWKSSRAIADIFAAAAKRQYMPIPARFAPFAAGSSVTIPNLR